MEIQLLEQEQEESSDQITRYVAISFALWGMSSKYFNFF
jgi:hypothetical protein